MKRPAVFFDRDNTLIVSDGYLGDPAGVVLVDGAADAVARARALGCAVVTFSNQSGVARGMFGEEAVHAVNSRLDDLLHEDNPAATIDRHEFCPYHPDGTVERYRQASELRKPQPGMIHQAAQKLGLDLSQSWVVGDAPRDVEAGRAAGCRTILLKVPDLTPSPAARDPLTVEPEFMVGSLAEALDVIERHRPAVLVPTVQAQRAEGEVEEWDDAEADADVAVSDEAQRRMIEAAVALAAAEPPLAEAESGKPAMTWGERMRAARARKAEATAAGAATDGGATVVAPAPVRESVESSPTLPPDVQPVAPGPADLFAGGPPAARPAPESPRRVEPARPDAGPTLDAVRVAKRVEPTDSPAPTGDLSRLEELAGQILDELRRGRDDQGPPDFSVSKLLAGIIQVLTFAAMAYAYFIYFVRNDKVAIDTALLMALSLQTLTIALLIMGRQK